MQPVVLIVAPDDDLGHMSIEHELIRSMPNMGIMYLAAALEARGFPVITRDYSLSILSTSQIVCEITAMNPILVGFTMVVGNVQTTGALGSLLRPTYSGPIVVGGYIATFHSEDVLNQMPAVNWVVVREGEETIVALMEHLVEARALDSVPNLVYRDNGTIRMTMPAALPDVTKLPWPRRDWNAAFLATPILARRGCYGRCSFCSIVSFYDPSLGPLVRRREVIDVVNEIEDCIQHGRNDLGFYDDCFGMSARADQEWCMQFIRELARRQLHFSWNIELRVTDVIRGANMLREMCDLGLAHIVIGMETMLPRQLILYNKGYLQKDVFQAIEIAKTLPLDFQTQVIFWDPWTTLDEAAEHLALLDQIGVQKQLVVGANSHFFGTRIAPRRGTALHNKVKDAGLLVQNRNKFWISDFTFQHPKTAAFCNGPVTNIIARLRRIPQPSALWLRVIRLEREEQHSQAQALRKYGLAISSTAFDYFKAMLSSLREIEDPVEAQRSEQEIHDLFAPKLNAISKNLPLAERHV